MDIIKRFQQLKMAIKDPDARFAYLSRLGIYDNMPDKEYLSRKFKFFSGKPIDWENPKTFNEKLQWMKVYDRKPIYTEMVDKYTAKKYVAKRIGNTYIIPTLGIWDKFDDINFERLPNQFVLKCTHDSGGLVICRDKQKFSKHKAKQKIEKSLKRNYYKLHREWPYKNVKPRIIAEQYMEDSNTKMLTDYKFFCFDGEPKFVYVSTGLENHATAKISFLTLDWQFEPFERSDFAPFSELPRKPKQLDLMIELAKELSKGHRFLRVDLYEINNQVYFSELTFTPCAGMLPFKPEKYDRELGDLIHLNDNPANEKHKSAPMDSL